MRGKNRFTQFSRFHDSDGPCWNLNSSSWWRESSSFTEPTVEWSSPAQRQPRNTESASPCWVLYARSTSSSAHSTPPESRKNCLSCVLSHSWCRANPWQHYFQHYFCFYWLRHFPISCFWIIFDQIQSEIQSVCINPIDPPFMPHLSTILVISSTYVNMFSDCCSSSVTLYSLIK